MNTERRRASGFAVNLPPAAPPPRPSQQPVIDLTGSVGDVFVEEHADPAGTVRGRSDDSGVAETRTTFMLLQPNSATFPRTPAGAPSTITRPDQYGDANKVAQPRERTRHVSFVLEDRHLAYLVEGSSSRKMFQTAFFRRMMESLLPRIGDFGRVPPVPLAEGPDDFAHARTQSFRLYKSMVDTLDQLADERCDGNRSHLVRFLIDVAIREESQTTSVPPMPTSHHEASATEPRFGSQVPININR